MLIPWRVTGFGATSLAFAALLQLYLPPVRKFSHAISFFEITENLRAAEK